MEENGGVYVKEEYLIPAGMGKYIPVQTNCEIMGDNTVTGLILPEIVYNVKKKLACIFIENHNSEHLELKKGQKIGLVISCVVAQAEQSQLLEKRKEDKQSITGRSNDRDTCIGSASGEKTKKAGQKAGSVQSIEN